MMYGINMYEKSDVMAKKSPMATKAMVVAVDEHQYMTSDNKRTQLSQAFSCVQLLCHFESVITSTTKVRRSQLLK